MPKRQHFLSPATPLLLVAALMLTLVSGCGSRKAASNASSDTPNAPIEQRGDWFCQPALPDSAEPWDCVQDPELAKNPKPDRLPDANIKDIPNPGALGDDAELPPLR